MKNMSAQKGKSVLEQRRKYLIKAKELYDQGLYAAEIARLIDVPNQTIVNWVRKFREGSDVNEMMRGNKYSTKPKGKRITGINAPASVPENLASGVPGTEVNQGVSEETIQDNGETREQKIARLERELRDSRMEAALYKEIIRVAEENLGIRITKKAGAKP